MFLLQIKHIKLWTNSVLINLKCIKEYMSNHLLKWNIFSSQRGKIGNTRRDTKKIILKFAGLGDEDTPTRRSTRTPRKVQQ